MNEIINFDVIGDVSNKSTSQASLGPTPESKVHGAKMGPTWVLSASGGTLEPCYQGPYQRLFARTMIIVYDKINAGLNGKYLYAVVQT